MEPSKFWGRNYMLICNGHNSPKFPSGSPIYRKQPGAKNNNNNTNSEVDFGKWAPQEPSFPSCGFSQTVSSFSCPLCGKTGIAKDLSALPLPLPEISLLHSEGDPSF